ncbi:hypothetical protein GCM10027418_12560 [Mariniluteicoccus endophyticus]
MTHDRTSRVSVVFAVWYAVRTFLLHVVIDPVREGGPQPFRWARPVRVVVGFAALVFAALTVATLLKDFGPEPPRGTFKLSPPGRWLAAAGTTMVLYCLYVASVHLRLWLQLLIGLFISGPIAVAFAALFMVGNALGRIGPTLFFLVLAPLSVVVWVLLVVLAFRQRRRPLSGRFLCVSAVLMLLAYGLPNAWAIVLDPDQGDTSQLMIFLTVTLLHLAAMPISIASGVAFSEIITRAVSWSMVALRDAVPAWFWRVNTVVLALVIGWRATRQIAVTPANLRPILAAAGIAVATLAVGWFALQLARSRGPVDAPRPEDIATALGAAALQLGLVSAGWMLFLWYPDTNTVIRLWNGVVTLVCLVFCVRAIRAGRTAPALLHSVFAVGFLHQLVWFRANIVRDVVNGPVLAAVLVGALVWWGVRHRLTTGHWVAVSIGLASVLVWPYRQELAEPINLIPGFGEGATGALVFGLVWRVLTDGAYTRQGTPSFPMDSRALLFAAHLLTAGTASVVVGFGSDTGAFDLENGSVQGMLVMGRYALFALVLGLLEMARFHVDPDPEAPPPPALLPQPVPRAQRESRLRLRRKRTPAPAP